MADSTSDSKDEPGTRPLMQGIISALPSIKALLQDMTQEAAPESDSPNPPPPTPGAAHTAQDDAADIPEEDDSSTPRSPQHFPMDLWDYLDGDYHRDLPYMPSRHDRDALARNQRRTQIWDYFFRFKPEDIGKPQQREITKTIRNRRAKTLWYQAVTARKGHAIRELETEIDVTRPDVRQDIIPSTDADLHSYDEDKQALQKQIDSIRQEIEQLQVAHQKELAELDEQIKATHQRRIFAQQELRTLDHARQEMLSRQQKDSHSLEEKLLEAERRLYVLLNQKRSALMRELELLKEDHARMLVETNQQIDSLRTMIETLKQQVPTPPSDEEVFRWLDEDLERLQRDAIRATGVGTRLAAIRVYDQEGNELVVDNPIVFVTPGEIQDVQSIPPTYLPPAFDVAEKLYAMPETPRPGILSTIASLANIGPLTWLLRPKPIPDQAKHLLVRRKALISNGYKIVFGVYYVECLIVTEEMMILYSTFFDFITGKLIAEKILEQYYQDVIAIEQRREYRAIPLSYHEAEKLLVVENVPTFSLILPSGDRRTVTFANRSYYVGIVNEFEDTPEMWSEEIQQYIDQRVGEAEMKAHAVINVLRKYLRDHKGKQYRATRGI